MFPEQARPDTIRPQAAPTRAAEGQDRDVGPMLDGVRITGPFAGTSASEHEPRSTAESDQSVTGVDGDAALSQTPDPRPQERRGLHVRRKHSATGADDRLDAEVAQEAAQIAGTEGLEPLGEAWSEFAVACDEALERLGVRDVQPTDSGDQQLATDRRHRLEDRDFDPMVRQHVRGDQPSGSAAHDVGTPSGNLSHDPSDVRGGKRAIYSTNSEEREARLLELVASAIEQHERFGDAGVDRVCRDHAAEAPTIRRRIGILIALGLIDGDRGVVFRHTP